MEAPGRRERNKRRTRAAIQRAALELFAERGYGRTTVAAVADRADVAVRTVAVHFPTKDELLFADDPFDTAVLAERLARRGPTESALEVLRGWMADTMQALDRPPAGEEPEGDPWAVRAMRSRLIAQDDALRGKARAGYRRTEDVLAAALAEDLGLDADGQLPRLAALALVAGLREVYDTAEARTAGGAGAAGLMPLVDRVLAFARGGLDAAGAAPSPTAP